MMDDTDKAVLFMHRLRSCKVPLTALQLEVLLRLRNAGGIGTVQGRLVHSTGATRPAVSKALKYLADQDMVASRYDMMDRRVKWLVIRSKGIKLVKELLGEV